MYPMVRWGLVVTCLVALGGVATAGNPLARPAKTEARDHLDRGNRLYNTRSFEAAIEEFKAGALVESAPVFDYNLGQAYRQLGKYKDAIWHYNRFLNYGQPTGELLDAVQAFLKEMHAQLENRAQSMPPTEPAAGPEPPPQGSAARAAATSEPAIVSGTPSTDTVNRGGHDWLGWGITGAGVAAMATGSILLLQSSNLSDQGNEELDSRKRDHLHDQARTRGVIGVVVGIGGVVLTAGGVVKLLVSSHGAVDARTATIDLGTDGHGVFVVGQF
jgi:tetratricopeptide (TPR) repeat protein